MIPADNSDIHTIRQMTDPSCSIPAAHPQFGYSSTGFQPPMATHCYQAQDSLSVPPLANAVYYSYPNPRYPLMYCSPFVSQYPPLAIPIAHLPPQGTYFYTPEYHQPYPENHSLSINVPNAPPQQPQLHAPTSRWPPAQSPVAQYHITNAFSLQIGPQPMQPSFSHPVPSAHRPPQQSSTTPSQYIRRHSHPARTPSARARPELLQLSHPGWAQVTGGNGQPGGQSITRTATALASNIIDQFTADITPSSIQLNSLDRKSVV